MVFLWFSYGLLWEIERPAVRAKSGADSPGGGCRNVRLHAQHHSSTRRLSPVAAQQRMAQVWPKKMRRDLASGNL